VLRLQELTDEQEYEAELSQCVGVTAYHRWFFISAFAEALGLRMRAFAVESGGERLGVIPLLLRRRGPVSTVNQVPVTCVGPVLRGETLRSGRVEEMLRAVEPVLRAERAVVTKWAFTPGLDVDLSQLAPRGFQLASVENFAIPGTKSIDDYLKGLAPKQRAAIRRGGLRGLSTGPSTKQEIMQWFPGLVSGEQSRQGRVSEYSLTAARRLAERLADEPRLLWRSVRGVDGQTLVMNASIIDTDRLWGWLLVGDPVPGPSPHVAAMWDAIEWSLTRNLTCDFGGATSPGNRDFKVAMGGEVEWVAVAERIRPKAYVKLRTLHSQLAEYRAAKTR
jgi:hypothetical protein